MDLSFLGPEIAAFAQVILIDLVLAGDNAIVVGLAAAGLPAGKRNKVILIGIIAATALRIIFALGTKYLLAFIGLTFAGGILLMWVCWKFWRELEHQRRENRLERLRQEAALNGEDERALESNAPAGEAPAKTMTQAVIQIVLADVSMSLDNVLAVAGATQGHPEYILIFGLGLSVLLMGVAASLIAKLLKRYHWIAYVGLAVIFFVAARMIWHGWAELEPLINGVQG